MFGLMGSRFGLFVLLLVSVARLSFAGPGIKEELQLPFNAASDPGISSPGLLVHNRVIFKFKGQAITVLDVVHKMNLLFFIYYESCIDSLSARSQFYQSMWSPALDAVIDEFLMQADAEEKKIKIEGTDVKKEIVRIFGEKLDPFLVSFDMTYDDVYQTVFRMILSQKMLGMMVRSKATLAVTPRLVKDKYQTVVDAAVTQSVFHYNVVNVRAKDSKKAFAIAEKVIDRINSSKTWDEERVKAVVSVSGGEVSISKPFVRRESEMSDAHRTALITIEADHFVSKPFPHKEGSSRFFVLHRKEPLNLLSFAQMEDEIKRSLIEDKLAFFDKSYKEKLRYRYGYEAEKVVASSLKFDNLFSWL